MVILGESHSTGVLAHYSTSSFSRVSVKPLKSPVSRHACSVPDRTLLSLIVRRVLARTSSFAAALHQILMLPIAFVNTIQQPKQHSHACIDVFPTQQLLSRVSSITEVLIKHFCSGPPADRPVYPATVTRTSQLWRTIYQSLHELLLPVSLSVAAVNPFIVLVPSTTSSTPEKSLSRG
ncbi:hypothetical protein NL676_026094 [Syzygium grande]|nr:hypothetical protein NL676_026094 [Syzygium grande]